MQVNMLEAKNRLSSLIVAAEQGEEVLIARPLCQDRCRLPQGECVSL